MTSGSASWSLLPDNEERSLATTVHRFVESRTPISKVRELLEDEAAYDRGVWESWNREIGVAGLLASEQLGGIDASARQLCIIFEELGRGLVPLPFLATSVLAASALNALDISAERDELLTEIANGRHIMAVAVSEAGAPAGAWAPGAPTTRAVPAGDHYELSGAKTLVINGADADTLLVLAMAGGEPAFFAVDPRAAEVVVRRTAGIDPLRAMASVTLHAAPARLLAGPALEAVRRALLFGNLAVAAEQCGAMHACITMTAEYAQIREAFGRRIGSFQGVKHQLADSYLDWELGRALLLAVTADRRAGVADLECGASAARVAFGASYLRAAFRTVQLHGGIGFTWEHDAHLYYKNAISQQYLFGRPADHLDRVAELSTPVS